MVTDLASGAARPGLPDEPQPGGREPAPGRLGLVQAFANTYWDLEQMTPELWRSPAILTDWLIGRCLLAPGVQLGAADLRLAITVREGVRSMLFEHNGHEPGAAMVVELNSALRECPVTIQFDPLDGSPHLVASDGACGGALATLASIIALAQLDDSFGRLKACPGPDCGWAFYDHSRNRTSAWCSMSICGARVKARSYRARRRDKAH